MSSVPQDESEGLGELDTAADSGRATADDGSTPAAGVHARFAGRTAVGLVREHNEDNFVVASLASEAPSPRDEVCEASVPEEGLLFAVCDGMGGAAAGEVASQMAVDILFEVMRRGGPPSDRDDLARRLVAAVEEAGRRIYDEAQKERSRRGMGTTATATVLVDKVLFIAEVGDSRAYLLRNGTLKQLTKDQSLVNQLIEAGHLTEEEADAFEHSNIILQALGTSESVQVDLTFVELRRGDRLMLCSDGLSGLVADDTIAETLQDVRDTAECTKTLIEYAEEGGGHDNITVIVVDFDGDGLAEAKETDTFGYLQYPLPLADGDESAFNDDETTAAGIVASDRSPPRGDGGYVEHADGRDDGTAMLWLVGGVVALLIGATVLALSSGQGTGKADEVADGIESAEVAVAEEEPPGMAEETNEVAVRVHTDVAGAKLLINGEPSGALAVGSVTELSLRPGAYRFEAESDGNVEAVAVVTVREGVPLDVVLNLPNGAEPEEEADTESTQVAVEEVREPAVEEQDEAVAAAVPPPLVEEASKRRARRAEAPARPTRPSGRRRTATKQAEAPAEREGATTGEQAPQRARDTTARDEPAAPAPAAPPVVPAAPVAPVEAPTAPAPAPPAAGPPKAPQVPDNPF
ncbi:MAG: Stp1/IreP family PP2C-type Ser/Thr phosphatase [Myxococcales bacterium]|nr:Stp1/IreP family PP2C-type Ser/Thr phosphatase [Myxococcales bacterium]